ncbi:hypothetical protein ACFOYW_08200 [Gryllotalpicola reticulitermitis]|uniref:CopC domain-containing protein n=1 Tax=Gryllotalpicola reticulitermitis TaxID=1184153 RepID=A0ABV8Q7M6_9MICO
MIFRRPFARVLAALGLASVIGFATPLAAQAASYPPASPGTFSVMAHPGTNRVTINGLGANAKVTALVSGRGPAPALGPISGSPKTQTANLAVGKTDAAGSVTFNLVFASGATGVYNVSVSTPDGHSVSGSMTIPSKSRNSLNWTGANIALWIVWLAGLFIIVGIIALLANIVRRRARG